jgi:hypothetical protein
VQGFGGAHHSKGIVAEYHFWVEFSDGLRKCVASGYTKKTYLSEVLTKEVFGQKGIVGIVFQE